MLLGPDSRLRELVDCRVTTTLLVASLTLSILHLQGSDLRELIADPVTWKTEPWKLLTSTLLHVNVLHLVFNLYWTARFGMIVERTFGAWSAAGLFALLAVTSSAPQVALEGAGIGLSGIGYGLFGFLWVLSRWDRRDRIQLDGQTIGMFVVWFFLCIIATYTDMMAVGNVAHGAGAVVGAAIGWAVANRRPGWIARGWPLLAVLSALVLASTILRPYLAGSSVREQERFGHAWQTLQSGDNSRAEPLLAAIVEQHPDESWAWWGLGVARWKLGDHERALTAFERSAALQSPSPEDQKFLGEAREYVRRLRGRSN